MKTIICHACGYTSQVEFPTQKACDNCLPLIKKLRPKTREVRTDVTLDMKHLLQVYRKQDNICTLCGEELNDDISIDHIQPISRSGYHEKDNIQLLHWKCNQAKAVLNNQEFLELCNKIYNHNKERIT